MAREFSNGDAANLLKHYKRLLTEAKNIAQGVSAMEASVAKEADAVLSSQELFDSILDQLKTGLYDLSLRPSEKALIASVQNNIEYLNQYEQLKTLKQKNDPTDASYISQLSSATSSLRWFFAGRADKTSMTMAYHELQRRSSELSQAMEKCKKIKEGSANSAVYSTYDQLRENKDKLLGIIHRCAPRSSERIVPQSLDAGLTRYKNAMDLYVQAKDHQERVLAGYKSQVQKSIQAAIAEQAMKDLSNIEVEKLSQVQSGIRVKALRDSGFDTVAKVYAAPKSSITSVYGISPESASMIKMAANVVAANVQKATKLRLSTDDQSPYASGLLISLYAYDTFRKRSAQRKETIDKLLQKIKAHPHTLRNLQNTIGWMFMLPAEKDRCHLAYADMQLFLKEGIDAEINQFAKEVNTPITPLPSFVWHDFAQRSIEYYNLIEEIAPGVLGNDNSLYGLPEELAKQIQDEAFFPDGLKVTLRRYQEWGVKYILHQGKALLGDEMGLGKTVQAIATMVSLKNTGAKHFMVVCPASVLPNWCKEVRSKSRFDPIEIHGAYRNQAVSEWIRIGGVAITTYETLNSITIPPSFKMNLLVVDEAHFIKNEGAIRSKNVRALGKQAGRILFMTGTALENKVEEMVSLIQVLQPAIAYRVQNMTYMSAAPQFREMVAPVYYRRKREDVLTELPAITEVKEWCDLYPAERDLYKRSVIAKDRAGIRKVSWTIGDLNQSAKARRLKELVQEAADDGRKVLVFSFYLETIQRVIEVLGSRCTAPINGSVSVYNRQAIIDEFERAPAGKVLPAQIQAGGTGLNIQAASVVIICEPQLKPSIENQAISRVYRMGQTRKVLVYRLLATNTIDERIDNMLSEKQAIFDAFADKSSAAAATQEEDRQIDDKTFGKLIQEEIDRINAEEGNTPAPVMKSVQVPVQTPNRPVQRSIPGEKAKDNTYQSMPSSGPKTVNSDPVSNQGRSDSITNKDEAFENVQMKVKASSFDSQEREEAIASKTDNNKQDETPDNQLPVFTSEEKILALAQANSVPVVDNRSKNGCLWIKSGDPLVDHVLKAAKIFNDDGIEMCFRYSKSPKAFNGEPAWYLAPA